MFVKISTGENLEMPSDSTGKTIGVALLVTIVSSILVSMAVVILRPMQEKNIELDKKRNVLLAIGKDVETKNIESEFSKITAVVVDLTKGTPSDYIAPEKYNLKNILKSPETSIVLSKEDDIAGIHVIPRYQLAYLVFKEGKLENIIIPVYGKGLWSTIYGFLALENDFNTVKGLTFYEHGETPGLGGEIENPQWKAIWPGKKIYGDENEIKIEVIKGSVDSRTVDREYKVDGISGATLTSRGVSQLIRFWASDNGFGKYFKNLKGESLSRAK